ncbi:MAG: hypothetical protein WC641_03445 [Patescibacteria group bacterium]
MSEHFANQEKPKICSIEDIKQVRELLNQVGEVIGWDLGAFATTKEEVASIEKVRSSLEQIEKMFGARNTRVSFQMRKDVPAPTEEKNIAPNEMQQIRTNLAAIEETIGQDIGLGNQEDAKILANARVSLKRLKEILG